jgi:hypothetical protein
LLIPVETAWLHGSIGLGKGSMSLEGKRPVIVRSQASSELFKFRLA